MQEPSIAHMATSITERWRSIAQAHLQLLAAPCQLPAPPRADLAAMQLPAPQLPARPLTTEPTVCNAAASTAAPSAAAPQAGLQAASEQRVSPEAQAAVNTTIDPAEPEAAAPRALASDQQLPEAVEQLPEGTETLPQPAAAVPAEQPPAPSAQLPTPAEVAAEPSMWQQMIDGQSQLAEQQNASMLNAKPDVHNMETQQPGYAVARDFSPPVDAAALQEAQQQLDRYLQHHTEEAPSAEAAPTRRQAQELVPDASGALDVPQPDRQPWEAAHLASTDAAAPEQDLGEATVSGEHHEAQAPQHELELSQQQLEQLLQASLQQQQQFEASHQGHEAAVEPHGESQWGGDAEELTISDVPASPAQPEQLEAAQRTSETAHHEQLEAAEPSPFAAGQFQEQSEGMQEEAAAQQQAQATPPAITDSLTVRSWPHHDDQQPQWTHAVDTWQQQQQSSSHAETQQGWPGQLEPAEQQQQQQLAYQEQPLANSQHEHHPQQHQAAELASPQPHHEQQAYHEYVPDNPAAAAAPEGTTDPQHQQPYQVQSQAQAMPYEHQYQQQQAAAAGFQPFVQQQASFGMQPNASGSFPLPVGTPGGSFAPPPVGGMQAPGLFPVTPQLQAILQVRLDVPACAPAPPVRSFTFLGWCLGEHAHTLRLMCSCWLSSSASLKLACCLRAASRVHLHTTSQHSHSRRCTSEQSHAHAAGPSCSNAPPHAKP